SAEASTVNPVTAVAEQISDKGDIKSNPVQGTVSAPFPTTTEQTSDKGDIKNPVEDRASMPTVTPLEGNPVESSAELPALDNVPSVTEFSSSEGEVESNGSMSQITNVTQLRDVSPGDWAFEALRSLVERYGCIAGYPDGTYRGNRSTSRYEFAAGLNACLQQIERIIQGGQGFASRKDLETLQRLVDEFKPELTALGTRVDKLDGRVAFLEDHQFSTTTKLSGLAWMNITGATAGRDVQVEAINAASPDVRFAGRGADGRPIVQKVGNPSITMSTLAWLTFNTSFTGKDLLVTQLATGNGLSPTNQFASAGLFNTFGVPFLDQTAGPNNGFTEVVIHDLFYQFPVSNKVQLVVGPRVNWNRFFDNNAFTFFLTGGSSFNSNSTTIHDPINRGSGVVALVNLTKQFDLHLGYLGENNEFLPAAFGFNTSSDPSKGLFSGTNAITAELTYKPSSTANIRLIYSHNTLDNNGGVVSAEPIYGVADDGQGGRIKPATVNAFGINFDWLITPKIGLFGRYGYATTDITPSTAGRSGGKINSQAFQFGLGFPDLGKQGALATLSFVVPFDVLSGRRFLAAGGGDGGTQYDFEATYHYPITNNIAIIPAFYLIGNANNFDSNPTIYVGNLRAQFSF
ncbi:iron uptake porin, partial [Allocoleopsis sp.]|uniref:iron uptake porin n=1 Tax=Allocoleopsis sp. TaxID=3088169 RepID=UPI002FD13BAA